MLRMISHPIVSGATPARQLKKGPNPKCNEYLIYAQIKYRFRAGSTNTSGAGAKSPAQGTKPRTGLSEQAGGIGLGYERSGFTNGNDNTPRICV